MNQTKLRLAEQAITLLSTGGTYARSALFAGETRWSKQSSWQLRLLNNMRSAGVLVRVGNGYDTTYHARDPEDMRAILDQGVGYLFHTSDAPDTDNDPVQDRESPQPPDQSVLSQHSDREILECCYQWITHLGDRVARLERKLDKLVEVWK